MGEEPVPKMLCMLSFIGYVPQHMQLGLHRSTTPQSWCPAAGLLFGFKSILFLYNKGEIRFRQTSVQHILLDNFLCTLDVFVKFHKNSVLAPSAYITGLWPHSGVGIRENCGGWNSYSITTSLYGHFLIHVEGFPGGGPFLKKWAGFTQNY
jgi:hypothetical protein